MTTIISIHILRSLPPHCVNRDQAGLPKIAAFGGVQRSRVSSQAQKRAWRTSMGQDDVPLSTRTREAYQLLTEPLTKKGHDAEDAWKVTAAFLPLFVATVPTAESEDERQIAMSIMALSEEEIKAIVDGLHECFEVALLTISQDKKDKKGKLIVEKDSPLRALAKKLTARFQGWTRAMDIAMFGRMVASNDNLEIPAAIQVAHMLSTSASAPELDYWTGLDDLAANAAMLGETYFASAVYYQNANIDWDELLENLSQERNLACRGVRALLRSVALRLPSGRRNGFFGDSVPGLMLVEKRNGAAFSLANAFETPIATRDGGLMHRSARALATYWPFVNNFAGAPSHVWVLPGAPEVAMGLDETPLHPDSFKGPGTLRWIVTLDELVEAVLEQLS